MKSLVRLITIFFLIFAVSCAAVKETRVPSPEKSPVDKKISKKGKKWDESPLETELRLMAEEAESKVRAKKIVTKIGLWERFRGTPLEEKSLLIEGALCEEAKELSCALSSYEKLMERYPGREEGYSGAMRVLLEKNSLAEAERVERSAKEIIGDISSPGLLVEMAALNLIKRRGKKAEEYLSEAKERGAGGGTYNYNMALAMKLMGNVKGERDLLLSAGEDLDGDPLYSVATGNTESVKRLLSGSRGELSGSVKSAMEVYMADKMLIDNEIDEAEERLRSSLSERGSNAEAYIYLGNIMFMKGRFKEAGEKYEKAIELNPYIPEAYLNLGLIGEVYVGDEKLAESSYVRYIELGGPEKDKVKKRLESLKFRRSGK